MGEGGYKALGWACLIIALGLAIHWSFGQSGLAGIIMDTTEKLTGKRLVQISWAITIVALGLPGLWAKRYFDALAWEAHVAKLPPPNVRESVRKSKYVKLDEITAATPPPPQAVDLTSLPEGQMEFIATCSACGHLFSARRDAKGLKCPSCGEPIPIS